MKQSGIYLITHLASGRHYVGRAVDLRQRRAYHAGGRKDGARISNAIRAYGWGAFSFDIIEHCPRERLNDRERYWIAHYNCRSPNGLNLTSGGEGCDFAPEALERLRLAQRNRSEQHRANHLAALRTPEYRAKISAAGKGRIKTEAERMKLSVACANRVYSDETRKKMAVSAKRRCAEQAAIAKREWAEAIYSYRQVA